MAANMRHVVQLVLPLTQFVATLSRQLSWSDFVNLLPLKRLNNHQRQSGGMTELVPNALRAELTRFYWSVGHRLFCVDSVGKIEL